MKIEAVRTHLLVCELAEHEQFQASGWTFRERAHLLVEIDCGGGLVGWGECLGPAKANRGVVEAMAGLLIGRNPLDIEPLWLSLYDAFRDQGQRGLTMTALSGIDVALWDIAGRHFGVPVSRLMGGAFRSEVAAYATGGFRAVGRDPIAALSDEMAGYAADGFSAAKIKIGFGVAEDLERVRAAREALGPKIRLMIDANHGYDAIEAVALGRAAAEFGVDWFEEPVVPEQIDAYCDVRARQPIPVAGGETWHGRALFAEAIRRRAVDILQPDICGCGGLTEIRKIASMAETAGIRVTPHVWGTGIAVAAALQFLSTLPPAPPRHEARGPILEFDRTPNPFRMAVLTDPIVHRGGAIAVPEGPGLGVEVDRAAVAKFTV